MSESTTATYLGVRERWLTTGLLGIGLIVFAIEASVSSYTLPKIMTSLRVELYQIHWVLTAFGIARTVIIPMLGWLSGRIGPRLLYILCLGTFCLGSLGSSLAWDWGSLLLFRVLAGLAGGLIQPLTMAIFYQIFPPSQRGMALAFSLIGWAVGPSIGSFLAGYVLEFASWRTAYAVVVPMGGLGSMTAWFLLPNLQQPDRRRLDQYGLLTMAVAITTLILALSQGNREGWDSQYILTLFAIAGVATVVFVIVELWNTEPLVELRLFCQPPFVMAAIVLFLSTVAFRGTGPMMQVLMQSMLGFAPLLVAWTQLPSNLTYGVGVLIVGRLSDRISPHFLILGGLFLYAWAFWVYAGVNELTTIPILITLLCLRFTGEACIGSPNNLIALRALPDHQVMMAAGLLGLLRSIAATVGMAFSAVFWDQRYQYHIRQYATDTPADHAGMTAAMDNVQEFLVWSGEIAPLVPAKSMALVHQRLLAEAGTAAWGDYFMLNTLLALAAIVPAFLANRRWWRRRGASSEPEAEKASTRPDSALVGEADRDEQSEVEQKAS
ncbi:DHA2 family efflux MFS transporter permease subunit [Candidatus Entotheonella palauensis]|uniref:DHA2 family efflux MFS transporter permease subunit n=1 Tax=Candidatus Entotheonella palauensis TaxID=93172 RepID=UPI000B7DB6A1|nr:DHA2 family efflux MFS transporter permease subunit [Candidatus Entotheonella palauensis]